MAVDEDVVRALQMTALPLPLETRLAAKGRKNDVVFRQHRRIVVLEDRRLRRSHDLRQALEGRLADVIAREADARFVGPARPRGGTESEAKVGVVERGREVAAE